MSLYDKQQSHVTAYSAEQFSFSNPAPHSLFSDLLDRIRIETLGYEEWFRVSCGLKSSGCPYSIWDNWNRNDPITARYTPRENRALWDAIDPGGAAQFGTVMEHAKRGGFVARNGKARDLERIFEEEARREAQRAKLTEARQDERQRARTARNAARIIERSRPATDDNPYLARKLVKATPGLFEMEAADIRGLIGYAPKSNGKPLTGRILIAPIVRDGSVINAEMIDASGLKAALFGKGTKGGGFWTPDRAALDGDGTGITFVIGEGVATALSGAKGFGKGRIIPIAALTSGNLRNVAKALRDRFPNARVVVLADLDKRSGEPDGGAVKAAQAVGGLLAVPEFKGPRDPTKKDFNDLWCEEGILGVSLAIAKARPVEPADDPGTDDVEQGECPPLPESHRQPDYPEIPIDDVAPRIVEEMRRLAQSHGDNVVVFAGDVGSGKTHAVIREALAQLWRITIFAPTHELSDQTAALAETLAAEMSGKPAHNIPEILRLPVAQAIRGRGAKLDKDRLYCDKKEFTEALKEKGLSRSHKILGCVVRTSDGGIIECPLRRNHECAFYNQKLNVARIKTLSHEYLANDKSEMAKFAVEKSDLFVVDESPLGALTRHALWTDNETIRRDKAGPLGNWLKHPILAKIADAVLNKAVISDQDRSLLLADVRASVQGWQDHLPAVFPNMSDQPSANVVMAWSPNRPRSEYGMLLAAERWLSGHVATLYPEGGGIGSSWLEPPALLDGKPVLIIDASADEALYRSVFGERLRYVRFNSPIASDVDVIQLTDHSGYRAAMERDDRMVSQISALALAHKLNGHDCGLIGHKDHLELFADKIGGGVDTAHHGALRGLNTLENKDALFVVGRSEPDIHAVERITRALFPASDGFGETGYATFSSPLQCVDGTTVPVPVHHPRNPLTNLALRSIREEGLRQAIGRLRHTRPRKNGSSKRRLLIVATNIPIPGLKVTPVTREQLFGSARLCKALVKGEGVAVMAPDWLRSALPDEFPSAVAAKEWLRRERVRDFTQLGVVSGNRYIFPETTPNHGKSRTRPGAVKFSVFHFLRSISFRVDGEAGRFTRAVSLYPTLEKTRAALERALNAQIVAIGWDDECEPVKPAEAKPAKPSRDEKRGHLYAALSRNPEASNREIARMAGVDESTVRAARAVWAPAPPATLETALPAVPPPPTAPADIATVWTVTFHDGRTATLNTPGGVTLAEAGESAARMMPGVVQVAPRARPANGPRTA